MVTWCSVQPVGHCVAVISMMHTYIRINKASLLHLIAMSCCVAATDRIVHLRTPKETTVGKIMDSCIKTLGMTEDRSLFIMKDKPGAQYSTWCTLHNICYHKKTKKYHIHTLSICFDFKIHPRSSHQISRLRLCWCQHQGTGNWNCTCVKW